MKKKSLFTFFIFLLFSISFTSVSCKNESNQTLDPSMFSHPEDASDSSEDTEIQEIHVSGTLMNIDSVSEGIIVHLTYPKTYYPYFKLFITNKETNKEIYITHNESEGQNDIVFVSVSQNNFYRVTLYVYTSEDNYKKNYVIADSETKSIKAIGGLGEYTFTSPAPNSFAAYDESNSTLTFNMATSSNTVYESKQTFDLYIYEHTTGQPIEVLEKYSNLKNLTATDNTYDVSPILQQYDEPKFGLLEKLQFCKAGESDYIYEVIYNDSVFSHNDIYISNQ